MPNLHWTMPVARWSYWSASSPTAPDVGFIEPMARRRLSSLSRMALKVAHDCAAGHDTVRMVFASRHGELRRTTDILHAIAAADPVSPNAFSLSVLNAMSGMFGIARGDRSAASALSAGPETLGYALLEAHAQYSTARSVEPASTPVLVVYADEPVDPLYGTVDDEVEGGALALLINAHDAQDAHDTQDTDDTHDSGDDLAPGHGATGLTCTVTHDEAAAGLAFPTQAAALVHCLTHRTDTSWRSRGAAWQWRWHGDAA